MSNDKGVNKVIIAGGDYDTFIDAGGKIDNTNYLGSLDFIKIRRDEWGVGHKQINGGLMPCDRLRMEKLGSLVYAGRLDVSLFASHVYNGWEHLEVALF